MPYKILVVDHSERRRKHLMARLSARLKDVEVSELATRPPSADQNVDSGPLEHLKRPYDLVLSHIGGNPSGYECLKTFKEHNPKGKVVLFTKEGTLSIDKFDGFRLADAVFQRSQDDAVIFPNDDAMVNLVSGLRSHRTRSTLSGVPDKVTISWLKEHVPLPTWGLLLAGAATVFGAGVTVGSNQTLHALFSGQPASPASAPAAKAKASGP